MPSDNRVGLNVHFWWLMTPCCCFGVFKRFVWIICPFEFLAHVLYWMELYMTCRYFLLSVFCHSFPFGFWYGGNWVSAYKLAEQGCTAKPPLQPLFFPHPSLFISLSFLFIYTICPFWFVIGRMTLTFPCWTKLAFWEDKCHLAIVYYDFYRLLDSIY